MNGGVFPCRRSFHPLWIFGAFLAIALRGISNDLYFSGGSADACRVGCEKRDSASWWSAQESYKANASVRGGRSRCQASISACYDDGVDLYSRRCAAAQRDECSELTIRR